MDKNELYERYTTEYKAIKKEIKKKQIIWFLAAFSVAIASGIAALSLYYSNGKRIDFYCFFCIGLCLGLLPVSFKNLTTLSKNDQKRLDQLNQAYEIAVLTKD